MYSSILPKRAREAYRCTRWKDRLDARATTLIERGYSSATLRIRLPKWVDFVGQFESRDLPTDIECPEVRAYIDRRSHDSANVRSAVRTALRLLLEPEDEISLRLRRPPRSSSPLYEAHVPAYLDFARRHCGRSPSSSDEWVLNAFFTGLNARGIDDIGDVGVIEVRDYLDSQVHLARRFTWRARRWPCRLRFYAASSVFSPCAAPVGLSWRGSSSRRGATD